MRFPTQELKQGILCVPHRPCLIVVYMGWTVSLILRRLSSRTSLTIILREPYNMATTITLPSLQPSMPSIESATDPRLVQGHEETQNMTKYGTSMTPEEDTASQSVCVLTDEMTAC